MYKKKFHIIKNNRLRAERSIRRKNMTPSGYIPPTTEEENTLFKKQWYAIFTFFIPPALLWIEAKLNFPLISLPFIISFIYWFFVIYEDCAEYNYDIHHKTE